MSALYRADLLMKVSFILFVFVGLSIYSQTRGQVMYKIDVKDSLIIPYDSDLLEFIDFNR